MNQKGGKVIRSLCTMSLFFCLAPTGQLLAGGTNSVPAEFIAKVEALERQARLGGIFADQTNAAWNLGQTNLLRITVIQSEGSWYPYSVKENGKEDDHRTRPYAVQDSNWKDLSAENMLHLHAAIAELPSESASPPLERTVLLSFKNGTNWVNRTYDYKQQPKALGKIFEIIGERWETKGSK